jgi:biotin synthase
VSGSPSAAPPRPVSRARLDAIAAAAIEGEPPSPRDALALLAVEEESLLDVVAAAARVRRRFFGDRVRLNFLLNMKSGGCPEDCYYCAQRRGSEAGILRYSWLAAEEAAELADRAAQRGVRRVCLVASGRGPSGRDVDRVAETVEAIRRRRPEIEVCACLGLLGDGQAERLREAGADAYNHNLNTSEGRYPEVCGTHGYGDRVDTVRRAGRAGLSACSGAIVGMGESDREIVELAFELRELEPCSVPVNFLIPFEGTPMAGEWQLTPQRCLSILALFRFVFPDTELRLGGGREVHLRTLQPLALHVANSIFLGDYLVSEGQEADADVEMIEDAGLVVDGAEPAPRAERRDLVASRSRGPGSDLRANA